MAVPPVKKTRALECPNCGGAVELRGFAHTLNAVCIQCLSILDAKSPELRVLQTFQGKQRYMPLIPLGTRGKLHGDPFEAIGFQVRQLIADGEAYQWSEYLLFNPYKGFRYLTEYRGHWNDVITLRNLPETKKASGRPEARLLGERYKHFQSYVGTTIFVMGEFPWQVRVGDNVQLDDFVAPPRMLSREKTPDEVTWSLAEYTPGEKIWQAFGLKGEAPPARGVYANQPSPTGVSAYRAWTLFFVFFLLLVGVMLFSEIAAGRDEVFRQKYSFTAGGAADSSYVTSPFELKGRPQGVEVRVDTDLDNNWAYFSMALIDVETGDAYDFGREVSYYHGRDSDGNWTEGSKSDTTILPSVPPGSYYLRVEPEMDAASQSGARHNTVSYEIRVRRGVANWAFFWVGFFLLLVPPVIITIRRVSFESARWREGDYAMFQSVESLTKGGGDD